MMIWKTEMMNENYDLPQVNFSRNYLLISAFVIPMTGIGIFFLWFFTIPMIQSLNNGQKFTQNEIWSMIILNVLILGLVLFAWIVGYTESSIEITEMYVKKKGVFRHTMMRWSEIISIYMIGTRIAIRSHDKKLQINTVYFREPDKLITFIRDHHIKQTKGVSD